jgi:hypothetical protein
MNNSEGQRPRFWGGEPEIGIDGVTFIKKIRLERIRVQKLSKNRL